MSAKNNDKKPFAYFKSLDIENIKCFKGKHHIDLTDKDGKPAKWTVIMGNNGTGKTTLLRCLADLEPATPMPNDETELFEYKPFFIDSNLYTDNSYSKLRLSDKFNHNSFETFIDYSGSVKFLKSFQPNRGFEKNVLAYGIHRKARNTSLLNEAHNDFSPKILQKDNLINAEEWLLISFLAYQNGIEKAQILSESLKKLLIDILPDVYDYKVVTDEETLKTYVLFKTDFGWVRMNDLGYGYQSMLTLLIDFAKNMYDKYPDSHNPLSEPAVVLVDEIALHLHPDWQRDIISFLDNHFPKTQFIVTTHSPLVVQSAENVNLVILEKDGDGVRISQPEITNLQGWSIEEIMSDIMGLNDEIFSDEYLALMEKFEKALNLESYEMAEETYNKLDKILHPSSTQRTLMKMQMSGILPVEV